MANDKALVSSGGVTRTVPDADTLLVGSGVRSNVGQTLTITADTGSITFASNFSGSTGTMSGLLTANGGIGATTALNLGHDATTTSVVIGDGSSVASITVGKVGQLTTFAGNVQISGTETVVGATVFDSTVTIGDGIDGPDTLDFNSVTGRLASTTNPDVLWLQGLDHQFYVDASTTTNANGGSLSIAAGAGNGTGNGGNLTLNAGTGTANGTLNLGTANTALVVVSASGQNTQLNGTLTLQNTALLTFTGGGMINLPQSFQVNGVSTAYATPGTGQVTATNLNTLTAGPASNADALHTHSFNASATGNAATGGVTAGQVVAFMDQTGSPVVAPANAASAGGVLNNAVGFATVTATAGNPVTIATAQSVTVLAALWDGGIPAESSAGSRVYVSDVTPGNVTLTAPTTSGSFSLRCGILQSSDGTTSTMVLAQIGEGVYQ